MAQVKMEFGDVVFFKRAKASSRKDAKEIQFQGHGFGVLLGLVPHFAHDPPASHLFRLMGGAGFLSFDDVREFLGDEQMKIVIEKFQDKYNGPDAEATKPDVVPPQTTTLFDASGNPVVEGEDVRLIDPLGDFLVRDNGPGLDL